MPKKIGQLLVEMNIIDEGQLEEAMKEQSRTGERLGTILINRNFVTVEDFEYILSHQQATPPINLAKYTPSKSVTKLIPEKFMRERYVVPVEFKKNTLTVAMANPHDFKTIDELRFMTGHSIGAVVSSMYGIKKKINELFPKSELWEGALEDAHGRNLEIISAHREHREENIEEAIKSASDTPTVKIVNSILLAALDKEATHIHLIPNEEGMEVKLRVNGMLNTIANRTKAEKQNMVNRVKVLGGMDIIQRRAPLGGYFRIRSDDQFYDIEVTSFPITHGEHMVLTFQQPFSKESLLLDNLGMDPHTLELYREAISAQRGLFLFVGTPDSGKTSTIYATLNELKNPGKVSATYENPIKNQLVDIIQTEPYEKQRMDYAGGLKSLVRQNLDYLMIGEMNDARTMKYALEAALGKTMVFGKMIYNSTAGIIPRVLDLEIPAYMLYTALAGVVGQRLVRKLCTNCLKGFYPPDEIVDELRIATGKPNPSLYRAVGCEKCGGTGYQGRTGVFELLVPNEETRRMILSQSSENDFSVSFYSDNRKTMLADGLNKAVEGITTYEEVKGAKL